MTRHCLWSDDDVPDDQAVQVGTDAYACPPCVDEYGLLPLSEHPKGSTGMPLSVNPRYIGRRNAPPIAPGRPA